MAPSLCQRERCAGTTASASEREKKAINDAVRSTVVVCGLPAQSTMGVVSH